MERRAHTAAAAVRARPGHAAQPCSRSQPASPTRLTRSAPSCRGPPAASCHERSQAWALPLPRCPPRPRLPRCRRQAPTGRHPGGTAPAVQQYSGTAGHAVHWYGSCHISASRRWQDFQSIQKKSRGPTPLHQAAEHCVATHCMQACVAMQATATKQQGQRRRVHLQVCGVEAPQAAQKEPAVEHLLQAAGRQGRRRAVQAGGRAGGGKCRQGRAADEGARREGAGALHERSGQPAPAASASRQPGPSTCTCPAICSERLAPAAAPGLPVWVGGRAPARPTG